MTDLMTQALLISNSLDYDLINQLLWLIAIILKFVIGLAALSIIITSIILVASMMD